MDGNAVLIRPCSLAPLVLLAAAIGVALLLSGCGERLTSYRYRLTVEVETPEGLRTGSSVIEARPRRGVAFPGPEAASLLVDHSGEAVVVDLGARGILFALLTPAHATHVTGGYEWALMPGPHPPELATDPAARYRALAAVRGNVEVRQDRLPLLVRFRDVRAPASVERVYPDDLERPFGADVRLRRITVEITNDAVEHRIADVLPWLPQYVSDNGRRLNGTRSLVVRNNDIIANLGPGSFIVE